MLLTRFSNRTSLKSPPSREKTDKKVSNDEGQRLDQAVVGMEEKTDFATMVGTVAALALSLAPQIAKATPKQTFTNTNPAQQARDTTALDLRKEPTPTEPDCCGKEKPKKEKKKWQPLKGQILPPNWTAKRRADLGGDWKFSTEPIDVDVQPRWEDGPALKFRGDFFETRIQKTRDLGNDWNLTRGYHGKIRGEIKTYEKPILDLDVGAFREWRGPLTDNIDAKFTASTGFRARLVGTDQDQGLRAHVSMRQELEGLDFQAFGDDYRWYLEARQSVSRNFTASDNRVGYRLMVGPKRDFKISAFGKTAKVTVAAGPEFKGRSGEAFSLGAKARVKIKL